MWKVQNATVIVIMDACLWLDIPEQTEFGTLLLLCGYCKNKL